MCPHSGAAPLTLRTTAAQSDDGNRADVEHCCLRSRLGFKGRRPPAHEEFHRACSSRGVHR